MTLKKLMAHIILSPLNILFLGLIIILAPIWVPLVILGWAYEEVWGE